jgi:hypothetical protein
MSAQFAAVPLGMLNVERIKALDIAVYAELASFAD